MNCSHYVNCPESPVLLGYSLQSPFTGGAQLIQNGGFETGDFTDWTLSGNDGEFSVGSSPVPPNSGSSCAQLNTFGTVLGFIAQTVITEPGQNYQISFWWRFQDSFPPSSDSITAYWNGTEVWTVKNGTKYNQWQNVQIIVSAPSSIGTISFGIAGGSSTAFGIDDVTLTSIAFNPAPLPDFIGLGYGPTTPPPLGWNFQLATGFAIVDSTQSPSEAMTAAYSAATANAESTWVPSGGIPSIGMENPEQSWENTPPLT